MLFVTVNTINKLNGQDRQRMLVGLRGFVQGISASTIWRLRS